MGQYRASTGPMLAALAKYWPGTGPVWHVYGDHVPNITIYQHYGIGFEINTAFWTAEFQIYQA